MKITTQPLENHQVILTIELDEERVQKEMRRAARRLSRQVNIPGFRRGKAPYDRVLLYFGEETIRDEVVSALAEEVFEEALKEADLDPYELSSVEIPSYNPLTMQVTVSLRPTVELGDYRSYRREYPEVTVSQEEIEEELEHIRMSNSVLEPVERAAEPDDDVQVDIIGRTASGELFIEDKDLYLSLYGDEEEEIVIPGLYDFIVGMSAGDERTVTVTLPDDFPREDLRGQDAEITIKVLDVYERIVPALDDDLARTVGNYDSLEELEAHIAAELLRAKQEEADEEYANRVFDDIVAQAEVKYPPEMVEKWLDDLVDDYGDYVKRSLHLPLSDYLRFQGSDEQTLRDSMRDQAAEGLKRALVMWELIEREGLTVSDEEIAAEIERIVADVGVDQDSVREAFSAEGSRNLIRDRLLQKKMLERVAAIARGEAPELPPADEQDEQDEQTEE